MSTKANIYRPSMLAFVGFASHKTALTPPPAVKSVVVVGHRTILLIVWGACFFYTWHKEW
jgi:hypothetical protein